MELFERLAIALALGLLIGLERGWKGREAAEGQRIAGIRTFGLISLLGALWAMAAREVGEVLLGFAFVAFAGVLIAAHVVGAREQQGYGITTVVAALITFVLGALSMVGDLAVTAAAAVVTTVLLGVKPLLHEWVQHLKWRELLAAFKLLLISVVLLPVLPDRGYGPWEALNPRQIWWWVVLIATISFVGYFAVRIAGTRLGILFTAMFGGLASSTALTLNFSRLGRRSPGGHLLLSAGIIVAAATMFPRVLLEVGIVNPQLLPLVLWPMLAMTLSCCLAAPLLWRRAARGSCPEVKLENPFELRPALQFGVLLVAIMLLSKAAEQWFGATGIYVLAAVSGLSDVDAITLSLSRLARHDLDAHVAARSIVLASIVNTLAKGTLVSALAGRRMGLQVGNVFLLASAIGGATLFLV